MSDTVAPSLPAGTADISGNSIRLPVICRLRDVAALRQQLLTRLEATGPVVIDASDVESIDTGTLQLLYAFDRDRKRSNRATVYGGSSPAFRAAVAILGLTLTESTTSEH